MFGKKRSTTTPTSPEAATPSAAEQTPSSRGGRRRSKDVAANLRADAVAASEIVASYSEMWSAEQVLLHPELARLAFAEARSDVATRAGQPGSDHELAVVENAIALLVEAQNIPMVLDK